MVRASIDNTMYGRAVGAMNHDRYYKFISVYGRCDIHYSREIMLSLFD